MAKAQASGFPEDAQAAKDLDSLCERFEKKIHDLELTRMIAVQTAPQIRLVQGNDTLMAEKNSVYYCKHHSSLEKSDGNCSWRGTFHRGRKGAERSNRYDKCSFTEECSDFKKWLP